MTNTKPEKFRHEIDFLNWFNSDFPCFTSQQGQRDLEMRAGEIIKELDDYFNPRYMAISDNAKYCEPCLDDIRKSYAKKDYETLGARLESFKRALEWI